MSNSSAGLVLGTVAVLGVGIVAVKVFGGDKDKKSTPSTDMNVSDACEASLDKLPEPFHSMLLSPSTDLSDPIVIENIAVQLEKAGYKQQADCMRKFSPAIAAEHGVSGEDISDNCNALIDEDTRFTPEQRKVIKDAMKAGSREQLTGLANVTKPVNAKLGRCMEAVAKTREPGSVTLDKGTIDILNGVSGKGLEPMATDLSAFHASMVG